MTAERVCLEDENDIDIERYTLLTLRRCFASLNAIANVSKCALIVNHAGNCFTSSYCSLFPLNRLQKGSLLPVLRAVGERTKR